VTLPAPNLPSDLTVFAGVDKASEALNEGLYTLQRRWLTEEVKGNTKLTHLARAFDVFVSLQMELRQLRDML
jgi:hypothetical protein